jgi:hypothetical protein
MVTDRQTRIGLELETALAAAIDRPFRSLPRPDVRSWIFLLGRFTVAQALESRVVPVFAMKVEGLIQMGEFLVGV